MEECREPHTDLRDITLALEDDIEHRTDLKDVTLAVDDFSEPHPAIDMSLWQCRFAVNTN